MDLRRLWIAAAFGALGAVAACGGGGGTPDAGFHDGEAEYVAEHYDFQFELTSGVARADVRLRTTSAGRCFTIGFRAGAFMQVKIGDAVIGDATIIDGKKLHACDALGFPADSLVTLEVTAAVPVATWESSDVGYSKKKDRAGGDFSYLQSWVGECDRHGACDATPNRFATYTFTVLRPDGMQVLCPGTITDEPGKTTCEFGFEGGPTYSTFAVMVRSAPWTKVDLGDWGGGVKATLYDLNGSQFAAKLDVNACKGFLQWMVEHFGPYPYGDELRLVAVPLYWGGFEHPGNIALNEDLVTSGGSDGDYLRHTTLHEIGHMWAGDHTTLAGLYDFVWKEAMVEYLSVVYEDEAISHDSALVKMRAWKSGAHAAQYFSVPGEKPELLFYYGDVYDPGPMVLFRQLEVMYGRDKVLAAIASLIGGEARTVGVTDVQAALEAATGADLDVYFAGWIYGTGIPAWPEILASTEDTDGNGTYTLHVTATTADNVPRGAAFTVRLENAGATVTRDVKVSNGPSGGAFAPVDLDPGFVPATIEIDPDAEALVYPKSASKPVRVATPGRRAYVRPMLP